MWLAPDHMRGEVHAFNAFEGGTFHMSLIYLDSGPGGRGKTSENKDTFKGRFTELQPYDRIVEIIEFDSVDPEFAGEMTMTVTLTDREERTEVTLNFQNIPPGIRPEDNNEGSRQSLKKLAALLER